MGLAEEMRDMNSNGYMEAYMDVNYGPGMKKEKTPKNSIDNKKLNDFREFRKKETDNDVRDRYRYFDQNNNMDFKTSNREFVIGDLHFYDENIIKLEQRPFENAETAVPKMIDNWNDVVGYNDTVYVLGDFFNENCTEEQVAMVLEKLNGHIILIAGNHDQKLLGLLRKYVEVIEYPIVKDGFWIMSHEPMYVNIASSYANVFAHVHGNPMIKTVSPRSFCVSVERIGYKPILLDDVKNAVLNCE